MAEVKSKDDYENRIAVRVLSFNDPTDKPGELTFEEGVQENRC